MIKSQLLSNFNNIMQGFGEKEENSLSLLTLKETNTDFKIIKPDQIHSNKVYIWDNITQTKSHIAADGLITQERNTILCVQTADCIPIVLYEPLELIICILHVGWRGILSNIIHEGITNIKELGGNPKYIIASIGPHIQKCCFEVSPSTRNLFSDYMIKNKFDISDMTDNFIDITDFVLNQLLTEGLQTNNIENINICTSCRTDLFYSYRKNKDSKRMLNLICLKN